MPVHRLCAPLAILAAVAAGPVPAQDYIETQGPLSDDAFYRLVACHAAPGQPCQSPFVRWPKAKAKTLRVGITRIDPGFPADRAAQIRTALRAAMDEVNASGSALRVTMDRLGPDIPVLLLDIPADSVLGGTGIPDLDGQRIEAAYVYVWWNGRQEITRGAIVVSRDLTPDAIRSTMLEELVQGLGLLTDIANPHYTDRSIFSQAGYRVDRLKGQDVMALRRHYPN